MKTGNMLPTLLLLAVASSAQTADRVEPGQTMQQVAEMLAESPACRSAVDDCILAWVVPFCAVMEWPVETAGPQIHSALRPRVLAAMQGQL